MHIMTAEGWKELRVPSLEVSPEAKVNPYAEAIKKGCITQEEVYAFGFATAIDDGTKYRQSIKVDGKKVLLHHNKWWNYPEAAGYEGMFMDKAGDRRNGDGTLRPAVSFFSTE